MVVDGSLVRSPDSLRVTFAITDYKATVPVVYTGILPDLFAEGQGVVAKGMLDAEGVFQATEVLAKHDENYMPPEVKDMLPPAEDAGAHAAALGALPVQGGAAGAANP
jgi:cytochrome c-type biogenesis protein CcmE